MKGRNTNKKFKVITKDKDIILKHWAKSLIWYKMYGILHCLLPAHCVNQYFNFGTLYILNKLFVSMI